MRKEKVKFTDFGRGFRDPFAAEPDYYKRYSYDKVFNEIRKDIENNFYEVLLSAEKLKNPLPPNTDLTELFKQIMPSCPDLWESDSPSARKLVAHFGKLFNASQRGQSHQERTKAREVIDGILKTRTPYGEWSKIYIPPLLSLNDMCAYIHKITKYLRKKYTRYGPDVNKIKKNEPDILNVLKGIDRRLVKIAKGGFINLLINKPKEFTATRVANFLGLSVGGLKQKLKEEKRHPNTCHLKW